MSIYSSQINKIQLFSKQEEYELYERMVSGDIESRNRLVESQLRWISCLIREGKYKDPDELIQMCSEALLKNVNKWNPQYRLSTYTRLILRRTLYHYRRAQKRIPIDIVSIEENPLEIEKLLFVLPDESSNNKSDLESILSTLEKEDRNLIKLYYLDGNTLEKTSKITGLPLESLRVRLKSIVSRLSIFYSNH